MDARLPMAIAITAAALGASAAPAMALTFDVRASGADVAGYERVLRSSVHGAEISSVTVRVVQRSRIRGACRDARAVACYSRGRGGSVITIPARPAREVRATLLHEYGHHIDATVATPRWWAARRMAWRLRAGQVATDYSKGWSRSVGEVFAEDYVALHGRVPSAIRWLPRPSSSVLRALRRDITGRGGGLPPSTPEPVSDPAIPVGGDVLARVLRSGAVGRGQAVDLALPVDAPGRYVTVAVRPDPARGEVPVDIVVTCDGMAPVTYPAGVGETAYVRVGPVGPGTCTARVTGPPDSAGGVTVEVVLGTAAPTG